VYDGPAEELSIDMRGRHITLKKGRATKVSDADYEYFKCCKKKLNVVPVEEWDDDRRKSFRENLIRE